LREGVLAVSRCLLLQGRSVPSRLLCTHATIRHAPSDDQQNLYQVRLTGVKSFVGEADLLMPTMRIRQRNITFAIRPVVHAEAQPQRDKLSALHTIEIEEGQLVLILKPASNSKWSGYSNMPQQTAQSCLGFSRKEGRSDVWLCKKKTVK